MRKHQAGLTLFEIILGLLLCLLLISVSVTAILHFRPLYYADIRLLQISEYSGYGQDIIRKNYDVLIDYNTLGFSDPLLFPDFAMSESGRIHFEEVKVIFDLFALLAIILTPVCAAGLLISKKMGSWLCLLIGGLLGLLIPALLAVCVAVSWDTVFVTFHKLVFRNDFWLFDYRTDPVILILPDTFFLHCAILIFLLVFLGSIILLLFYKKSMKKRHNN